MDYEYLHPSQDPKYKFRKFHVLVEPFAYRQDEDDRIINDLLKFTNLQIQKDTVFQITFNQWATADNQDIMATPIQPGLMVGYHSHDFYEMCYSFADKVYQYINGDVVILNKGDVLFMHPDIRHSLCPNPCAIATNIHISKQYAKALSDKLISVYSDNSFSYVVNKKAYIIMHTDNEELDHLISEIAQFNYDEIRNNRLLNFYLEAKFDQMVAKLLMEEKTGKSQSLVNGLSRQHGNIEEIINYINSNYAFVDVDMVCKKFHYSRMQLYRIIEKIISETGEKSNLNQNTLDLLSYIENNCHERISSEHLSKLFHYHKNHLNRIIKQATGMTLKSYILTAKIRLAQRLYEETQMTTTEIAHYLNFYDVSHFIKALNKFSSASRNSKH